MFLILDFRFLILELTFRVLNCIKLIVLRISHCIHAKPDQPILKDIAAVYKYAEGSGKQKRSISGLIPC